MEGIVAKKMELGEIKISAFNARKHFDEIKMKELVASVKEKGVIQPIIVRPCNGKYEIVCGERRFRASQAIGLKDITVIVRELTDQQVLEYQVIENLQREDVHPMEEAEGYEQLMKKHGYKDVKDIAAKVGKSPAYIYGRLKLCELIPENRKFFYDGKFSPSVALLVARVPAHLQKEAGIKVAFGEYSRKGDPMPLQEARKYIHEHFMLQLKEAQFDTKEKGLGGKVSCLECLKRTGSQKELFVDIQGADICTDPVCFEVKKNAHAQRAVAKLKEQGKEVISLESTKKMFPYESSNSPEGPYVNIDDRDYNLPGDKTYRNILVATKDAKLVYAVHPHSQKIITLLPKSELPRVLKNAKIKRNPDGSGGNRIQDIAKTKTENRIREAKYGFWVSKVSVANDQRCRNVIILDRLLEDLGAFNEETREVLKGNVKCNDDYGRCWTISKLYELGDVEVQKLIAKVISKKSKALADNDLEFLATKLGFSMAKDYMITESYLQACTKEQLVKLAKELGINNKSEVMDEDKKSGMVATILKHAPKGKVPKELVK